MVVGASIGLEGPPRTPGLDAEATATEVAQFTSGTITIGTGVERATAQAVATAMATQSASDAMPRNGWILQVTRVFRASSVRGRHNENR